MRFLLYSIFSKEMFFKNQWTEKRLGWQFFQWEDPNGCKRRSVLFLNEPRQMWLEHLPLDVWSTTGQGFLCPEVASIDLEPLAEAIQSSYRRWEWDGKEYGKMFIWIFGCQKLYKDKISKLGDFTGQTNWRKPIMKKVNLWRHDGKLALNVIHVAPQDGFSHRAAEFLLPDVEAGGWRYWHR